MIYVFLKSYGVGQAVRIQATFVDLEEGRLLVNTEDLNEHSVYPTSPQNNNVNR